VCAAGACVADAPPPAINTGRYGLATAVLPDGTLYAVGGYTAFTSASQVVEEWTAASARWTTRAVLPQGVWSPTAVAGGDGRLHVFGGRDITSAAINNLWFFNTGTNTWGSLAPMTIGHHSHVGVVDRAGRIYAISGRTGTGTITTVSEVFDPAVGRWAAIAPIPTGVSSARGAVADDGTIWVFGGIGLSGTALTAVQIYNPTTNMWSNGPAMPEARYGHAVTRAGSLFYIAGGDTPSLAIARTLWSLDPVTRQYRTLALMPAARVYFGLSTLLDGRVVAVGGGATTSGSYLTSVNTYSPGTDTWR
jgi:N-acetylneuraminic acid mutarotase